MNQRLAYIDRCRGLAILLVVAGHVAETAPDATNRWYAILKHDIIYMFHIPLFFFISGFLCQYTAKPLRDAGDYLKTSWRKLSRLAPGYLFLSTAAVMITLLTHRSGPGSAAVSAILHDVYLLLAHPASSVLRQLWFLQTLAWLLLLFPLLAAHRGRYLKRALAVALVLPYLPGPQFFSLEYVMEHAFIFLLGAWLARDVTRFERWIDAAGPVFVLLFVCACVVSPVFGFSPARPISYHAAKTVFSLIAIPAVCHVMRLNLGLVGDALARMGVWALSIYLLHPFLLFAGRAIASQLSLFSGPLFILSFVTLTAIGVGVPCLLKKSVLPRYRLLNTYTG